MKIYNLLDRPFTPQFLIFKGNDFCWFFFKSKFVITPEPNSLTACRELLSEHGIKSRFLLTDKKNSSACWFEDDIY